MRKTRACLCDKSIINPPSPSHQVYALLNFIAKQSDTEIRKVLFQPENWEVYTRHLEFSSVHSAVLMGTIVEMDLYFISRVTKKQLL